MLRPFIGNQAERPRIEFRISWPDGVTLTGTSSMSADEFERTAGEWLPSAKVEIRQYEEG